MGPQNLVAAGDFPFHFAYYRCVIQLISDQWTTIPKKSTKQAWKKRREKMAQDAKKRREKKARKEGAKKRREKKARKKGAKARKKRREARQKDAKIRLFRYVNSHISLTRC